MHWVHHYYPVLQFSKAPKSHLRSLDTLLVTMAAYFEALHGLQIAISNFLPFLGIYLIFIYNPPQTPKPSLSRGPANVLYPSLRLLQLNETIKAKAYFAALVPKGSAIAETLQQSPEFSLQNVHSIDRTVRKTIESFVPTTLQRSVREICEIWQNRSVKNDSLVN